MKQSTQSIINTMCEGNRSSAAILYFLKGYSAKYKFMDEKRKVWILEGVDFFIKNLAMPRRTVIWNFKKLEEQGHLVLKSGWHPNLKKKTLMIKISKKTRRILGIKNPVNCATDRRIKTGQLCKDCTINSATVAPSLLYNNKTNHKCFATGDKNIGENILEFKNLRKGKKMKIKTGEGKGMEVLKNKKVISFDEVDQKRKSKKAALPKLAGTKVSQVEQFWKDLFAHSFPGIYQVKWSGKEQGYAKSLITKVQETGLDMERLLVQCFDQWEQFTEKVKSHKSYSGSPEYPEIGYLAANPQQFVNFRPSGKMQLIAPTAKPKKKSFLDNL